jgi:outer membrane protein insertion porin family
MDEISNQPLDIWTVLPFTHSGKLNIYKLIQDQNNIRNYYLNRGYIDAQVSTPLSKINFDNYSSTIDFSIKEGKRYKIKKVSVDYPKKIKIKLPKLNLEAGKYFNVNALREDLRNIKHAFGNLGYAYAKVYPDIQKKGKYAYVTYRVIPGEIVYIRNVIISGNTKTLDRVIRRNIFLAPKDRYNYQNLVDSKHALQRSGYLEKVEIKEKRVSNNKIDLIVKVKEGFSGSLRAGISYGSYTKLGVNFSVTEKDVFGSGQSLSASMDYSSVSRTYKLSLFNPRVFDSLYSFNASIYNTSFEGISYTSKRRGYSFGIGKRLTRNLSANITYGHTRTKLSDYNTTEYILPESIKNYVVTSLNYNSTDRYFFPTEGQKALLSVEYAGIGGDEKFVKTLGKYKVFYPLKNEIYETYAVLKFRMLAGYIHDIGYLPINEKFYLGGTSTIRGFSTYTIAPKDDEGTLIGGKKEFIAGPEVSTPLSYKNKIWLTGFVDYGAVGEDKLNITRSSYGVSIDWITPMGPISFIWAWPIKSEKGDDLQRFEFSLGARF